MACDNCILLVLCCGLLLDRVSRLDDAPWLCVQALWAYIGNPTAEPATVTASTRLLVAVWEPRAFPGASHRVMVTAGQVSSGGVLPPGSGLYNLVSSACLSLEGAAPSG